MIWKFETEIADTAYQIQDSVEAGENDLFQHASLMAHGVERMLERYFPELATATALDPQVTVERLLALYAAIHEDTANQPTPDAAVG
jgi:hypothetical protein